VRNVLTAGGCELVTRGAMVRLTAPRLYRDERGAGLPAPVRAVLRLAGVSEFLALERELVPRAPVADERVSAWAACRRRWAAPCSSCWRPVRSWATSPGC